MDATSTELRNRGRKVWTRWQIQPTFRDLTTIQFERTHRPITSPDPPFDDCENSVTKGVTDHHVLCKKLNPGPRLRQNFNARTLEANPRS